MGKGKVIKSGDMPKLEGKIDRRLAVRTVEEAVLRGMSISSHIDMKRLLDVRHRAADVNIQAIARSTSHSQAVGLSEMNDGVVIGLRWAESFSELVDGKELMV